MMLISSVACCAGKEGDKETEEAVSLSLFQAQDCKRIIKKSLKKLKENNVGGNSLGNQDTHKSRHMASGRIKRSILGFFRNSDRSMKLLLLVIIHKTISLRRCQRVLSFFTSLKSL